jgi:hypothetical protein
VTLSDGECQTIALRGGLGADVTVTETDVQDGFHLDRVVLTKLSGSFCQAPGTVTTTTETGPSVSGHISGAQGDGTCDGVLAEFYNVPDEPPPPPQGGEGCTPGYWKQKQHYDSWPAPYTPNTLFSAVFENAFPGKKLVDVLGLGGGGLNALGRHVVAALLNAGSNGVDYDLTTTDVINGFNAVFPGTAKNYELLKDQIGTLNEQGCPLN